MKAFSSFLQLFSLIAILLTLAVFNLSGEQSQTLSSKSKRPGDGREPIDLQKATIAKKLPEDSREILLKDPAINKSWGQVITESSKAWRVTRGSRDVVVAIIDTGVDKYHPSLEGNFWVNKGETGTDRFGRNKASNGIDDDGNGFIDDVNGWNFVGNNNQLDDNHGHGTHIAGIIGGNGQGVTGISPKVSLMILKYYDPMAPSNLDNTVKAINYAVKMNANIINYSGGGTEPSAEEKKAIEQAQKKGILFVAAAGNERSNSDVHGYYPADYGLSNIISVTAIDKTQKVLPSSNYGVKTVDIAAPGNEIYSTLPGGKYGYMTGTSQATAFATGVAALLMANNRDFRATDTIKAITSTGDMDLQLDGKTRYRRRLNSYRALAIVDQGVGVTGVVAENTVNIKPDQFAVDTERPFAGNSDSLGQLAEVSAVIKNQIALSKIPRQPLAVRERPKSPSN